MNDDETETFSDTTSSEEAWDLVASRTRPTRQPPLPPPEVPENLVKQQLVTLMETGLTKDQAVHHLATSCGTPEAVAWIINQALELDPC